MDSAYSIPGLRPPPNVRYVAVMTIFAVTLASVLYNLYKINNPASGPIDNTFSAKFIAVESHYKDWEGLDEEIISSSSLGGNGDTDLESGSDVVNSIDKPLEWRKISDGDDLEEYNSQYKKYSKKYDQVNNVGDRHSTSNTFEEDRDGNEFTQNRYHIGHFGSNSTSIGRSYEFRTSNISDDSIERDDLTGKIKSPQDGYHRSPHPLSATFIDAINVRYMPRWKAGRNFPVTSSWKAILALVATFPNFNKSPSNDQIYNLTWKNFHLVRSPNFPMRLPLFVTTGDAGPLGSEEETVAKGIEKIAKDLPEKFDARNAWPGCPSIGQLRDQGGCGSDWAEAPAAVISDRLCIHNKEYFHVSGYDLLTCCSSCGFGCNGGSVEQALIFYMNTGIVSGGPFGSNRGCKPNLIGPSTFAYPLNGTPICSRSCRASSEHGPSSEYWWARQTGYKTYRMEDPTLVRLELVTNGPLVALMNVYEDFFQYRKGVYQRVLGGYVGRHAVKVVGYGLEEGIPYYLCANSWGPFWGDKGFFKISRDNLYNFIVGY